MTVSLQNFVRDALAQVVLGIEDAKRTVGPELADQICPQIVSMGRTGAVGETTVRVRYRNGTCDAEVMRFDVAVYAGETIEVATTETQSLWSAFRARLGGNPPRREIPVTRIQFEIPVILSKPGFIAPWRPTPEMTPATVQRSASSR